MVGSVPLEEENPGSCFLSLPCGQSKKVLSTNQEEGPTRNQVGWHLDLGLPNLQKCEKVNFCYLSHPVYGIFLWQPEQTETST